MMPPTSTPAKGAAHSQQSYSRRPLYLVNLHRDRRQPQRRKRRFDELRWSRFFDSQKARKKVEFSFLNSLT